MSDNNKRGFFQRLFNDEPLQKRTALLPGVIPTSRNNTADVTLDSALGVATVYRSVNLITTGVSQLGLDTFRGTDKIDSPLLVTQPDNNRSYSSFLKRTATCLATNGNCYWKLSRNSAGTVVNIEVLNPLAVGVQFSDTGVKSYTYGAPHQKGSSTISDKNMKHLRYTEVPGHIYGVGPIQAYKTGLAGSIALRDYSDNWLQKSGVPTGLLKSNQELDAELTEAYKTKWHELTADGGVAVLGNGLDFTPLLLSAADIQFIESTNLSDLQVARIFGIDPAFLALTTGGSSLTYTNRQDLDIQFIRWTLMAYLMEIEDAMSSILPRGQNVKFNIKDFVRAYEAAPNLTTGASNAPTT